MRKPDATKTSHCRRCPFRAPSGQCLDRTPRSGRCGDWVYYPIGSKQHHRRYIKPKDPRTPSQLRWRKRLGDASRAYSAGLTDGQQDACIAAGSKVKTRPRFGQWGWLTGQQYYVARECKKAKRAEKNAVGRGQNTQIVLQVAQRQKVTRATWEPHRSNTVVAPVQHRSGIAGARKAEGTKQNGECRRRKEKPASQVPQFERVTPSTWERHQASTPVPRRECRQGTGCSVGSARVGTPRRLGTLAKVRWNSHWRELWRGG